MKAAYRLFALVLFSLLAISCQPTDVEVTAIISTAAPATAESTAPPFTPSATPLPTTTPAPLPPSTPAPQPSPTVTANPDAITFGAPFWLGRGHIIDAVPLPNAVGFLIGFDSSVAVVGVDGTAVWEYTPAAPVIAVAADTAGQKTAAALADGSVLLFDAATGNMKPLALANHNAYWGDLAFAPVGRTLATQNIGPRRGDEINLIDVDTGAVNTVPKSNINEGTQPLLAWSPDGSQITLAKLGERCSQILDVETGEVVRELAHAGGCYSPFAMAWLRDGRLAAIKSSGVDLLAADGTITQSFEGSVPDFPFDQSGNMLFFNEDETLLASLGAVGVYGEVYPLNVWDVATGTQLISLSSIEDNPRFASFFDGDTLVSLYADGAIGRWNFRVWSEEEPIGRVPVISPEPPLKWSADGRFLAANNRLGGAAVWEVETQRLALSLEKPWRNPALSADGRHLALYNSETGEIALFDIASGAEVLRLPDAAPAGAEAGSAFAPDGRHLAYAATGNRAIVVEVATGAAVAELANADERPIVGLIWSPDSAALVTLGAAAEDESEPGTMVLWERNAAGGFAPVFEAVSVRTGYLGRPVALFNPAGNLVAFEKLPRNEAGQFTLLVYDRTAGEQIFSQPEYMLAAWVSAEELLSFEAQYDVRATVWQVRTGAKEVGLASGNFGESAAPRGGLMADGGSVQPYGRAVSVRGWESQLPLAKLLHGNDIFEVSWSPDGRWLASVAGDGSIRVWPIRH